MPDSHFTILSTIQQLSLEPTSIEGRGSKDCPYLVFPLQVKLNPLQNFHNEKQDFDFIAVYGELELDGFTYKISEATRFCYYSVRGGASEYRAILEFSLGPEKLHRVESKRNGNAKFKLNLSFHIGLFDLLILNTGEGPIPKRIFQGFQYFNCNISGEIPQSHWVKKVLPGLGYSPLRLIEIPATNDLISDEYSVSIAELDEATKYFSQGDYDKVVAHCRSAIDPIKKKLPELKNAIDSNSEFEWVKKISEGTYSWLEMLSKTTASFSSKTHHPPSVGHFSRFDAEIIYLVTMAIVAYAGRIETEHN